MQTVRNNLSSIFIGADGSVYVLRPHTHSCVAQNVINAVTFAHDAPSSKSVSNFSLLSGGILRAQYYSDGIGVSMCSRYQATEEQIEAVRTLYGTTSMDRFVVEYTMDDEIVGHETRFAETIFATRENERREKLQTDTKETKYEL